MNRLLWPGASVVLRLFGRVSTGLLSLIGLLEGNGAGLFPPTSGKSPVAVTLQPSFLGDLLPEAGWGVEPSLAPTQSTEPPLQIGINLAGTESVRLSWNGPAGLSVVQRSLSLVTPDWQLVGGVTTGHNLSLPMRGVTAYYRVAVTATNLSPGDQVGTLPDGRELLPSQQIIEAAGQQLRFPGRPVDLVLSPDGKRLYVKNIDSLLVVDAATWTLVQTLAYPASGASMHGIAVSANGSRVYVTGSANELYEWAVGTNGIVALTRTLAMPTGSYPCGIALSADGSKAYVCLSIPNQLAVVDISTRTLTQRIKVGIAPWDVVLSPDGAKAFVSDWGGRFPAAGELTALSAGTPVVVDDRGVGVSGVVSFVDLLTGTEKAQVPTGLHPSDLELSSDGGTLFVADANSDTVTVIDTKTMAVKETLTVRPEPTLPYGSATDGLALSRDGQTLFVATAGNNAVAVVELPNAQHPASVLRGLIPTDWYPGAVAADSNSLYVANVKGLGSRYGQPTGGGWQIGAHLGTANKIPIPSADTLTNYTARVLANGRVAQIKDTQRPPVSGQAPVPVPGHVGEPSVLQHVLYILKENKTYDQVLGDLPEGNGRASLCIYPQLVSPNHHALAKQYVLLDNYYCNGVLSADGHSWSTEGNDTDHLEKAFGGFTRSYTFGDDALTYSSTGFIWNNALRHGLTFRNYGEMDYASPSPSASWSQIYADFISGRNSIRYSQNIGVESLRRYSSTNVPGWNLNIPDVVRAAGFIKELNAAEVSGDWATFHLLYLPNDHTGGPPSPRAQMADNDLSLGRVVDAVTHSRFGTNTVIFVIEDDPQSGYDHVDAHRSICLVISPYSRLGAAIHTFYNQAGVLHTMERIMGLPPMNQQDAMGPLMFGCFTNVPNYTPYTALTNNIPLTEGLVGTTAPGPKQRYWTQMARKMDFSRPDRVNDNTFNRYIWHSIRGEERFPKEFVGAHGKGLKRLGLRVEKGRDDDD